MWSLEIMELAACEMVIENEIEQGCTQAEIANTYAMALVSSWPTDWKRVNEAIESRGQWQPDHRP